ncbi:phage antirepressor Ant [[Haemophilus] felis]|nr:phage antirepressor Ant [[Haemophilus] felis]
MNHFQISTFTGYIQNQPVQLIKARELHQKLENGKQFSDWIQHRISKFKFAENLDFIVVHQLVNVDRGFFGMRQENIKEYHITLDMAKELCMLERSELGQQARRYFIRMEKEALQARQALPAPQSVVLADYISLSKDRYIELLERLVDIDGRSLPKPVRRTTRPLTSQEKQQILTMHGEGFSYEQIGHYINRSKSAVRAVVRENQGEVSNG